MKLIRYGVVENEKPGIFIDEKRYDISAFGEDYDEKFFATNGIERLFTWLTNHSEELVEVESTERWAAPISRPSKLLCIGLNYEKHAREAGMEIPKEPILFFKSTSSICGPYDQLIIPKNSEKLDWEVELAVVIGKRASYIEKEHSYEYIAGYILHNDYSERSFQLERGGQWTKGKSCDTFAPLGPYLVTKDQIPDPQNLDLWLKLNGELLQSSNTSDMIFDIATIVSYVSQFMTLLPGDIITTGTPYGVGMGLKPPRYISPGDIIELGIEGLGYSRQEAVQYHR
jgi:2-keto-4-pentenoate hydratase/2-oxohepta-3-ene-1,7-dioic acid hydratase in catechol pathway